MVLDYTNREPRLNAYYDFIHNYFPILPPRVAPASVDSPLDGVGSYLESPTEEPAIVYQPRSPLSLAYFIVRRRFKVATNWGFGHGVCL